MFGYELLPLDNENNKRIYYSKLLINRNKKDLEALSSNNIYTYKELFPFKKYSNRIERINTLKAYEYMLKNKSINKETLHDLYTIMSKDIVEEQNNYYRDENIYIINDRYDYDKAMNAEYIDAKMNKLFNYINEDNIDSEIDEFIKAQIIHFYLVYIHPYNDMNGRTARMLAMWHLLNTDNYQYLISNRSIIKYREDYLETIRKGRHTRDITNFINFMLKNTINELEIREKPKIKLKKQ